LIAGNVSDGINLGLKRYERFVVPQFRGRNGLLPWVGTVFVVGVLPGMVWTRFWIGLSGYDCVIFESLGLAIGAYWNIEVLVLCGIGILGLRED
jgi:hypothetical protein